MLLYHFADLFVDRHDRLIAAVRPQSLLYQLLKDLLLVGCRQRRHAAQKFCRKFSMQLSRIAGIVQHRMKIRTAIVKGREQKTGLRHVHNPVANAVLETIILRIVGEPGLGELHRAQAAEQVLVYLVGGVKHFLIIGAPSWNIIGSVNQQDQIILSIVIVSNNPVVEVLQYFLILQLAGPNPQQKLLPAPFFFFVQGKFHRHQIFANGPGQGLFKDIKIFKGILLRQREKGVLKGGALLLVAVHIAAADPSNCAALGRKLFFYLGNFFLIHFRSSPLSFLFAFSSYRFCVFPYSSGSCFPRRLRSICWASSSSISSKR